MTSKFKKVTVAMLMSGILVFPTTIVYAKTQQGNGNYDGIAYNYRAEISNISGSMYFSYSSNNQVSVKATLYYKDTYGKNRTSKSERTATGSASVSVYGNNMYETQSLTYRGCVDGAYVVGNSMTK